MDQNSNIVFMCEQGHIRVIQVAQNPKVKESLSALFNYSKRSAGYESPLRTALDSINGSMSVKRSNI
jgi:hypothetical protein